ncbi:MAG TPA: lipocalin family protein [Chitinophagaceae bacterium]|nr:lipocalin family protein [Chitinophagaceae bacterium]
MTNTKKYENDLAVLLNSLELSKVSESGDANPAATTPNGSNPLNNSPLAGKIWEGTSAEKFIGAGPMTGHYTGGFSTGQYKFNADGTYRFVNVLASHYTNTKTLEYETGTWSVNGNQLTINPARGQNEEWSKTGNTSNGNSDVTNRAINETWSSKLKTTPRKLEKYTYTFSIGMNGNNNALMLQRSRRTVREGEGKISYFNETASERSVKLPAGVK